MDPRTNELTAESIRSLFGYDPETGALTRRVAPHSRIGRSHPTGTINRNGYRQISINKRKYYAHRLVWLFVHGVWPTNQIDHINGHKDDNRIENLREATNSQNQANIGVRAKNRSGLKGAHWNVETQTWQSFIKRDGRTTYLGRFASAAEAHEAYLSAATALHGDFVRAE